MLALVEDLRPRPLSVLPPAVPPDDMSLNTAYTGSTTAVSRVRRRRRRVFIHSVSRGFITVMRVVCVSC